jgi:hypothetical protein
VSLAAFGQAQFNNTADMLAKVNPATLKAASTIKTLGFDTPGDGGGAEYRYVAGSTNTPLPNFAATGGAYEIQNWNGDVRACGAKPSTATNAFQWVRYKIGAAVPEDSWPGLQAASDAIASGLHGSVYRVPSGIYRLSRPLRLRVPYGMVLIGDGGVAATQAAINQGIEVQAAKSEFIRDFADGPALMVIGATNNADAARAFLQEGFSFNNYIGLIGVGDRFTSAGAGYATSIDFTNISPLVKVANSVRNHFDKVRFGRAHGSHLEIYKADDSHFTQCYFDSSSIYTNTWSTIAHGITYITNAPPGTIEEYDTLNTIWFEDCTWEVSYGGSLNFLGNIGGLKLTGVVKTKFVTPYQVTGKPNMSFYKVTDALVDVFCSGAKTFFALTNFTSPVPVPKLVNVDTCSGMTMRLRLQHISDGVNSVISNLVYLTNSSEIRLDVQAKSTLTNLLGDVINVDPSCYNISYVAPAYTLNALTKRFTNIPLRDYGGMGNWIGNNEVGMWGSTNTDAHAIAYLTTPLGTNDFTYYARVKLPPYAGVDKYIGGLSEFYTNILGGANSIRFFLTAGGDMVFRQAGAVTNTVIQLNTLDFHLWNYKPQEWVDLAWVRTSGANGSVAMYANGRQYIFGFTNLGGNNFATNWLHLADATNSISDGQWDGAIGTSGLIKQALTAEQVYRLPIDGPPISTNVVFWYVWDIDGIGWDRSGNNNHAIMLNGAQVRYGRKNHQMTSGEAVARLTLAPSGHQVYLTDLGQYAYNAGGLINSNLSVNNGNLYTGGASPFWQMFSTSNNGVLVDISGTSNAVFRICNNTTPVLNVITNGVVAGGTNTVLYISDGATAKQVHSAPDAASVPANARVLYILP